MTITDYQPQLKLQKFIQVYKFIESDSDIINHVLPGASLALSFRIAGDVGYVYNNDETLLPSATLAGLRKTSRSISYRPRTKNIVVLFTPIGASVFFREPLHLFYDQTVALENVVDMEDVVDVQERLLASASIAQQLEEIERFLLLKLRDPSTDALVEAALQHIRQTNGMLRMKELSRSLNISQDAFEKRFRRAIGATPKQFASIVRMHSVIRSGADNLYDAAYGFDFYDVAHFTKEFKRFTGKTPADFFRSSLSW